MINKIFLFLLTMLASIGTASAAEQLTVKDISIPKGGKATVTIGFKFDKADTYNAYQLALDLPAGISPVTDAENNIVFVLGDCYEDHSLKSNYDTESKTWIIVCSTSSAKTLKGTDGDLFTIRLKADASLEKGNIVNASVKEIAFSTTYAKSVKFDAAKFNITIAAATDSRIVLDEEATKAPESAIFADVRVNRTIKGGEWNTIVLPFAMSEAQLKETFGSDVKLGDFTGYTADTETAGEVEEIKVQFSTVTSLEANHPYVIKTGKDMTEFTVDDVTIDPENEPTVEIGKGKKYKNFVGSYVPVTLEEDVLFLNGGKFWYSAGKTKMKGYRGYFDFYQTVPSGSSSRIAMVFDDANATGIASNISSKPADNYFYNLQGQRISHPAKGIFIKGNKKVVKN